jgi:hypothetical protein
VGGTFTPAADSLEAIREHGDAAWVTGDGGGGGGFSGSRQITFAFVGPDTLPVPNVIFTVVSTGATATDAGGTKTVGLNDGTYTVVGSPTGGVMFSPLAFTVAGNATVTVTGTSAAITPPINPSDTEAYLLTLNSSDLPKASVTLYYKMTVAPNGSGYQFSSEIRQATSDSNGLWQAPLAKGATYVIGTNIAGPFGATIVIPTTADSSLALPNFYA